MNIIVHIGWHKTGTTGIQVFLKNNEKRLIDEHKIYYPTEGLIGCGHHKIAWALRGLENSPWGKINITDETAHILQAIESAKKLHCQSLVFSSEEFCTFSESEIIKLNNMLNVGNNKVTIIAYVRRQDSLIESSYNMEVKWWGSRLTEEFNDYIKNKSPFIKYDIILDSWANVFGLENIKVRVFDTNYMPKNDVRLDFCALTRIEPDNLFFDNKVSNKSLGPKGLAILRKLNRLKIHRKLHEKIVAILQIFEKPSKCVLFDQQQRIEFMEPLNDSNRNLAKFSINPDLLALKVDSDNGKK